VALRDLVADFQGLRDVSLLATRAAALGRVPAVRAELEREREEDDREAAIAAAVQANERRLDGSQRVAAMVALVDEWTRLSDEARQPGDSPERRMARRLMAWLSLNSVSMDDEYREMVREIRSNPGAR
jgi:hypothetical protein